MPMPVALHTKETVLEQWQDYSVPETKLSLDSGVERTIKPALVSIDLIIQRLGVSTPTARDAAKWVNYQLREKQVSSFVVKEYHLPRKEVADKRENNIKWQWWKPGPETVPLEEIPE